MVDRKEFLEAALDVYPEAIALLDLEERVVLWNRAAETMTGYSGADLLGRHIPGALEPLAQCGFPEMTSLEPRSVPDPGRGSLVHVQHKRGHDVQAIARQVILRDGMGGRFGTAAVFHSGEHLSSLPNGEGGDGVEVRESQAEMRDRLEMEFESFLREQVPLGILWITVDQAHELRQTHGARACETMLEIVGRTVANGLRPGEEAGRWGDDEFLVVAHEREEEALAAHAQGLAGQARTADFRWWGDRISLTVSVGAAAADRNETLTELLERARAAMRRSIHAGGNHVTVAPGRQACLPL